MDFYNHIEYAEWKQKEIYQVNFLRFDLVIRKDVQHYQRIEKCRSKLQWGIITPVKMTIIKSPQIINAGECVEKEMLLQCWWECKLVKSLLRTVWKFLINLKIGLPHDLAIPLLGIYPQKNNLRRYMHPNLHWSTIYNSQDMEAIYMSVNRGIDKGDNTVL